MRVLGRSHSRQPVREQVRHRQERVGYLESRIVGANHAQQLVERVDLVGLNARRGVDFRPSHSLERQVHHPVRAPIAIVIWVAEQPSIAIQEAEVDPPRIDAHAVYPVDAVRFSGEAAGQAGLDLRPDR